MTTTRKQSTPLYDWLFYLLIAAAAIIVIATHTDYAPGWDTFGHTLLYGKKLGNFYLTFGEDRSSFVKTNLVCYGGLFDVPCNMLIRLSPLHPLHTLSLTIALTGLAGVCGVRKLSSLIGGPAAGFWAALFLLCSAPWYGNMFINAKDISFAVGYVWGIYFAARYLLELPAPSWKSRLLLGVGLGLATGVRINGIVVVGYLLLFIGIELFLLLKKAGIGKALEIALSILKGLGAPVAIGYAMMIAFWPSALLSPILHPYMALTYFSSFIHSTYVQLGGEWFLSTELPARYLPQIFSVEMPEMLVAATLPSIVYVSWRAMRGWVDRDRHSAVCCSLVLVAALFPLAYVIAQKAAIYDNMRHFLFVLCLIVSMLGLTWAATLEILAKKSTLARNGLAALTLVVVGTSAARMSTLHPYEYTFKNVFAGGIPDAQKYYDTEYWLTSMPEAAQIVMDHATGEAISKGSTVEAREYNILFSPAAASAASLLPLNFKIEHLSPQATEITDLNGEDYFDFKSSTIIPGYDYVVESTRWHYDRFFKDLPVIGTVERAGMVFAVVRYNPNPMTMAVDHTDTGLSE